MPSDVWIPAETSWLLGPFAGFVLLGFSLWFLLGWHFDFPTPEERYMWRICAVVQAAFGVYGGAYYMIAGFRWHAKQDKLERATSASPEVTPTTTTTTSTSTTTTDTAAAASNKVTTRETGPFVVVSDSRDVESHMAPPTMTTARLEGRAHARWRRPRPSSAVAGFGPLARACSRCNRWLDRFRNISLDKDPEMALPMRVLVPVSIVCGIYMVARTYLYVEDYISLRLQPAGVYVTVNQYVPFWGGG